MEKNLVARLSLPQQNYIETIFELCEEHGHAHSKDIAQRLNIKMPSVTEALRSLSALGLVNYQVRKAITLTDYGYMIARQLECRHSTLADFFEEVLGCENGRANELACKIEHVIDCDLSSRLNEFMKYMNAEPSRMNSIDAFKKYFDDNSQCSTKGDDGLSGQCSCKFAE